MALATDAPWQAIATAALIGTERHSFQAPIAPGPLGAVLAQLNDQSTEAALLSAAGLVALHQHVGWLPETQPIPPSTACPADELPRCSPHAARCLQQILQGQYPQLLPEWLAQAAIANQRVPEMDIPALLDKGRQQRDLRPAILSVLGHRGRWLAAQNADWRYAVTVATDADWETGEPAARLLFLQAVRTQDPDRARSLLQSTWNQEPAGDRAKFLDTFRTGLSRADAPFLEEALGDRSKEVRRVAIDLLASLPDSRLCRDVTEHSSRYLSAESTPPGALQVQLPDHFDAAWIQLGIEPKPSAAIATKLGEKAWWLLQLIGATPLNFWTERWQRSPQEIVDRAQSHEWQAVLLNGFALAAKRQGQEVWLEAILKHWFARQASVQEAALIDLSVEDLFNAIPGDRRDALLINLLHSSPRKINDSLTIWLLRYSSQQWSVDLAQLVLSNLHTHFNDTKSFANADWELRTALKEFARLIPVVLTPEVIHVRSQLSNDSPWTQGMDDFLIVLHFRQEMIKAFER